MSTTASAWLGFAVLRIGQLICATIAAATLAAGTVRCNWLGDNKTCRDNINIAVGEWSMYDYKKSLMGGQYFVLLACFLLLVVSLALSILALSVSCLGQSRLRSSRLPVTVVCAACGLIALVAAIVEACYALGVVISWDFGYKSKKGAHSAVGWIPTSVFLFLASILYFLDASLTYLIYKRSYTVREQQPNKV